MEDIHRTHKEPAWGWIGALLEARKPAAPVNARTPRPVRTAAPARRAPC